MANDLSLNDISSDIKGIAHGSLNLSHKPAELLYFVDKQFDINNPDEKRIPWDAKGEDFWKPQGD